MSTPFASYTAPSSFQTPTPASKNRGGANTGSKRGRKPKGFVTPATPAPDSPAPSTFSPQPVAGPSIPTTLTWQSTIVSQNPQSTTTPATGSLNLPGTTSTTALHPTPVASMITVQVPAEDDEDEMLPAMADDDYSAQLSFQSQSKDNLKVLMESFTPEQYDRFEASRRHALPKQAVRKLIQQTLGQQVSQPVAQIVAGFSKVFVGEIIERARAVQARRGETGPLSPDHLREAYVIYQHEFGRVGAARPLRSKKLFVR